VDLAAITRDRLAAAEPAGITVALVPLQPPFVDVLGPAWEAALQVDGAEAGLDDPAGHLGADGRVVVGEVAVHEPAIVAALAAVA
jgi:hypothetical protein